MYKAFLFLFLFLFPFSNVSTRTSVSEEMTDMAIPENELTDGEVLFEEMNLGGIVNFPAFRQAVQGYNKIEQKKKPVLTLIDFTKPSTEKRLFVFDMKERKLLYSSVVAHGKNSGETMPLLSPMRSAHIRAHSVSISPEALTGERTVIHYYWMDWKKELTTVHASVPL